MILPADGALSPRVLRRPPRRRMLLLLAAERGADRTRADVRALGVPTETRALARADADLVHDPRAIGQAAHRLQARRRPAYRHSPDHRAARPRGDRPSPPARGRERPGFRDRRPPDAGALPRADRCLPGREGGAAELPA